MANRETFSYYINVVNNIHDKKVHHRVERNQQQELDSTDISLLYLMLADLKNHKHVERCVQSDES